MRPRSAERPSSLTQGYRLVDALTVLLAAVGMPLRPSRAATVMHLANPRARDRM